MMRILLALFALTLMASCVAPPPSRPVAAPVPHALPRPAPAAHVSLPADWRDWPLTPGNWQYTAARGPIGSVASFAIGVDAGVSVSCLPAQRRVEIAFPAERSSSVTIRTSTTRQAVAAVPRSMPGGLSPKHATATLPANDPLLDAIAFSRGRWTIEQSGGRPLVLPAYAEVARVVEDCRG